MKIASLTVFNLCTYHKLITKRFTVRCTIQVQDNQTRSSLLESPRAPVDCRLHSYCKQKKCWLCHKSLIHSVFQVGFFFFLLALSCETFRKLLTFGSSAVTKRTLAAELFINAPPPGSILRLLSSLSDICKA